MPALIFLLMLFDTNINNQIATTLPQNHIVLEVYNFSLYFYLDKYNI